MVVLPIRPGEHCVGGGYFSVIVAPSYVMWSPKKGSNSWHRDANWLMIDEMGNVDYSGSGYVPGLHTNVYIPSHTAIPVLEKSEVISSQSALKLNDEAQEFIEWDINFISNSCQHIHLGPNANIGNQQWLTYTYAWVDLAISTGKWNLFAPPFEGMVTGDMHIPASGTYANPLFGAVDAPDNRTIYQFWTSFFNTESYVTDASGKNTSVTATEWTAPFNALAQEIYNGNGYSIWAKGGKGEDTVVVRLPKSDTRYHYYDIYNNPMSLYEDVDRSKATHRLAGTNDQDVYSNFDVRYANTSTQLVVNPFVSDIDVESFMNDEYNKLTVSGHFTLFSGEDRTQITYNSNLKIATKGDYLDQIPAMTSFIVHLNPANTEPKIKVSPYMLATTVKDNSRPENVRTKASLQQAPQKQLHISASYGGVNSSCVVVEVEGSDKSYHHQEDSRLTLLNAAMTPSSIYTQDRKSVV